MLLDRKVFKIEQIICKANSCSEIKQLFRKANKIVIYNIKDLCDIQKMQNGLNKWVNDIQLNKTYI